MSGYIKPVKAIGIRRENSPSGPGADESVLQLEAGYT